MIRDAVDRLAMVIGAPPSLLPTYGATEDGGRPHIEIHGSLYHWVVVERGKANEREIFSTVDDLLYRVFRSVTFSLACDWEVSHRIRGQDSRRQMFAKQIETLLRLDPNWAEREKRHHEEIISRHPYND